MSSAPRTPNAPGTWPPIGPAARLLRRADRRVPGSVRLVRPPGRALLRRRLAAAIVVVGLSGAVVSGVVAYRAVGPHGDSAGKDPRVSRVYDPATGKLTMVAFAGDGSLRIDHWCYMDGERLLRMDVDDDRDGAVDRREYYGVDERLERTEYLRDGRVIRTESHGGQAFRPAADVQATEAGK